MDHIVYLEAKAKEMDRLAVGEKTMIIRSSDNRKLSCGRVRKDDVLYFLYDDNDNDDDNDKIKARAKVYSVINAEELEEDESNDLVAENQSYLRLTPEQIKKWSGKRYNVFIEITDFEYIDNFIIDKTNFPNNNDWLRVDDINSVKK